MNRKGRAERAGSGVPGKDGREAGRLAQLVTAGPQPQWYMGMHRGGGFRVVHAGKCSRRAGRGGPAAPGAAAVSSFRFTWEGKGSC